VLHNSRELVECPLDAIGEGLGEVREQMDSYHFRAFIGRTQVTVDDREGILGGSYEEANEFVLRALGEMEGSYWLVLQCAACNVWSLFVTC
jgi:hypothetical protein